MSSRIAKFVLGFVVVSLAAGLPTLLTHEDAGDADVPVSVFDPRYMESGVDLPSPTELAQWKADRKEMKREREEWIENMHRAPDVDWRRIEEQNRRAQSLERFGRIESGMITDQWTELGSANLAGRTMAAAPNYEGTLYIGSHLGGVWQGTIAGENWTAISDGLGLGSHQVLAVPEGGPGEPEVVFNLASAGNIHATSDGGATWFVPEGLPQDIYESTRLIQSASDPRTIYFLSRAREFHDGGGFDYGFILSRSTDGGLTFEFRSFSPPNLRSDVWMDRVNGGDIYLVTGNTVHVSADDGLTFQTVGTIPVGGTVNEIILAGSEAGAPSLYAAVNESGQWKIYRSTDAGATWAWRYDPSIWWRTFNASIVDPDVIYYGEVHCWRSTNGGSSFTKINDWTEYYGDPLNKLHADIPGVNIYWVDNQEVVYINTDGGTYVSYDNGLTVENLSLWGLGVSEYYGTFTSSTDPYLIAGGSQDQGFQVSLEDDGSHYLPFDQLISGDYGHLTSHIRDHNLLYCVYPGFILLQMEEGPPYNLKQLNFPNTSHLWMPPILCDPNVPDILYFCGDHIWEYERIMGQVHERTELPHDFGSAVTGLAISDVDPNIWYAATNGGGLWYSHDGGANWTETHHGPNPHYFYGTALVISPNDPNVAYAGGSGYEGHAVWKTTDGGLTWNGMSDGLPNTLVHDLVLGGPSMEDLFAACDVGPFGYDNNAGQWESLVGTEAPLTVYWTVEWVPEIQVVRFGSYGRGIWDYRPETSSDVADGGTVLGARGSLEIYPNPARENLSLRFRISEAGPVRVQLFDITGRRVATLLESEIAAGSHDISASLPREAVSSGIYFVRMTGPDGVAVRKVQIEGRL
jgi:photosystem II stability/assembly factor-like uncharacterized protein